MTLNKEQRELVKKAVSANSDIVKATDIASGVLTSIISMNPFAEVQEQITNYIGTLRAIRMDEEIWG